MTALSNEVWTKVYSSQNGSVAISKFYAPFGSEIIVPAATFVDSKVDFPQAKNALSIIEMIGKTDHGDAVLVGVETFPSEIEISKESQYRVIGSDSIALYNLVVPPVIHLWHPWQEIAGFNAPITADRFLHSTGRRGFDGIEEDLKQRFGDKLQISGDIERPGLFVDQNIGVCEALISRDMTNPKVFTIVLVPVNEDPRKFGFKTGHGFATSAALLNEYLKINGISDFGYYSVKVPDHKIKGRYKARVVTFTLALRN